MAPSLAAKDDSIVESWKYVQAMFCWTRTEGINFFASFDVLLPVAVLFLGHAVGRY
jgi:hypothetical protein